MSQEQKNQPHVLKKEELSMEQIKHEVQNQHDEKEPIVDKKLDGPNRPAE